MNKLACIFTFVSLVLASCGEEPKPQSNKAAPAPASQPAPEPAPQTPAPSPQAAAESPKAETPSTPARPSYTVRGEVDTLPGIESSVLRLHHERIPTFANKDGKIGKDSQGRPGMKPMTMSFAKGADVSYEGLKAGDKVEVTFEVIWDAALPDDRLVITKLTKLPAETKLDFEGQPSVSDPKPVAKPQPK
ncbi:MAG: copper-binding protein [Phycisphaerales bacterium]